MSLFDIFKRKDLTEGTTYVRQDRNEELSFYNEQNFDNDNYFFKMMIEDVFMITGRGLVVTGKISVGTIYEGDIVTILRTNRNTKIVGIEQFRKLKNMATKGENVGILLEGLTKADVRRGDFLIIR